nr:MAG: putative glycoprotein [Culex tenui-like virus]
MLDSTNTTEIALTILLDSLLTCANWEFHSLYFEGISDVKIGADSVIFHDSLYTLSYDNVKMHECYENISFTLVNKELVAYPSYDLKSELEKACSNKRSVLLWNFKQDCSGKCDFRHIKLGSYQSKVCQGSHCFLANGTIDQPFKLSSNGIISINNTYYPCKVLPLCDRYSDSYIYVKCSPWWFITIVIICLSVFLFTLLLCLLYLVYLPIAKFRIRSKINTSHKNYRVRMVNNRALIIPNSVSPNHTTKKTKKHFFISCCLLTLFLTVVNGRCDNSLDMVSYQEDCIVNSSCIFSSHSLMMYSSLGETKCFTDKMGNTYSVRLDKVSYKSDKLITYYVPDYTISTETNWRCSGAGGCDNGVFKTAPNDSFYIDFARTKTAFDGCFHDEDECKRIYIHIKPKRSACAVYKYRKLEPILHLTISKNKVLIYKEVSIFEAIKIDNITIRLQSYDLDSITHSIIDCDDYYIKRDSNLRNEYETSKYGLVQCETREAAVKFDKSRCKSDVSSLLLIIGDSVKIRENDLHTNPMNFANKFSKSTDLKDLLDIKDNFLYVLEMKANNTKLDSLIDLSIKAIKNVRIFGMMGLFNNAFIKYTCEESAGLIYLACANLVTTIICCRNSGENVEKLTINQGNYPGNMYCKYQYEFGEYTTIMVSFNLTRAEIVIYDTTFIDDNHFTENETLFDKFSLRSLILSYVQEYFYIFVPLVCVLAVIVFLKLINLLK